MGQCCTDEKSASCFHCDGGFADIDVAGRWSRSVLIPPLWEGLYAPRLQAAESDELEVPMHTDRR